MYDSVDDFREQLRRGAAVGGGPAIRWRRATRRAGVLALLLMVPLVVLSVATGCAGPDAGVPATGAVSSSAAAGRVPAASGGPSAADAGAASTSSSAGSAAVGSAGTGSAPVLRVVYVDVGQGDAEVVTSGSWAGLIDGGPPGSAPAIAAALRKLHVRRLDALVVSHLHEDHIGGLPDIVATYRPRRAYAAGAPAGELRGALSRSGVSVVQARRGDTLRWGSASARVLSPAGLSGEPNADSLVVLVSAGGRRFLFTGDCTGPNEAKVGALCARGPPVTVLKVAHHGSQYSTSAAFLAAVRAHVAVIEVGHNSYGHPTPETVARLRAAGARVYTTQRSGNISVRVAAGGALAWSFARSSRQVTAGSAASAGASSATGAAGGGSSAAAGAGGDERTVVYVTDTGECYHRAGCRYLAHSKIRTTVKKALAQGYRPCSVCKPPR